MSISVLTIAELGRGVLRQASSGPTEHLVAFVERVLRIYAANILPVDLAVAERWAELAESNRARGLTVGIVDELIAATAIVHDLTLVTRNVRHFEHSGCRLVRPWSG